MTCCHYTGRTRCASPATHHVYAPDGAPVPGGWICLPHGTAIVEEYRLKLGERWTLQPVGGVAP
jgi:hypothetical protein